ncbi:MAG TPA: hypothetical protein VID67_08485 [Rhizomicrobium sp.]|jgi:hypothetical protein
MTDLLPPPNDPHLRWKFLRDVLVFQLKLILGNVQNFVLVPVSLVAAALDLFIKGNREGEKFYKVMDWGRRTDEMINVYSAIGGYHATSGENEQAMYGNFTVDSILGKVEGAIVREYEKGGTAASIKGAVDRAIDGMQAHGDKHKDKLDDVIQRTAEKFRPKPDSNSGEN